MYNFSIHLVTGHGCMAVAFVWRLELLRVMVLAEFMQSVFNVCVFHQASSFWFSFFFLAVTSKYVICMSFTVFGMLVCLHVYLLIIPFSCICIYL